ncbi:MAG: hypothetical protein KAQ96_06050 [Thermoplasmata archaeon]|nr:hypothetical protein [Thermoplasmata archaeon]
MALRPSKVVMAAVLLVVAFWATVYLLAYLSVDDPEPGPFRMTLIVSGAEENTTDGNLTDMVLWIAVANGEPKPRWNEVDVVLDSDAGSETLVPPRLRIDDQDGNGRLSEGDLLALHALTIEEAEGTVTIWKDGKAIGTVNL